MAKKVSIEKDSRRERVKSSVEQRLVKPNLGGVVFIEEKEPLSEVKGLIGVFSKEGGHGVMAHLDGVVDSGVILGIVNIPENRLTSFEKMEITNNGISKKDLQSLKAKASLDYDRLAKMLSTTRVTLINKKRNETYSTALSEKILSIADIYSYGYEVFGDEKQFNDWMLSPIRALGGKAPFEIMNNQFGREEVKNIIGRIEYGVYS